MFRFGRLRLASKPVWSATFLLLLANISMALSAWILVWLVATFGSTSDVGEYALALAIVTPLFIVSDLSLRNIYVTLQHRLSFGSYLAVRVTATGIALVALVILSSLDVVDNTILLLAGAIRAVNSLLDLGYGALQRQGRLIAIASSQFLNSFLSIVGGLLAFLIWENVTAALVASLAGSIFTTLVTALPVARAARAQSPPHAAPAHAYRAIIAAGIPSGLAYASVSLLSFIPVYFLSAFGTLDEVGLFAVLAYFPAFAAIFFGSLQQASLHNYVRSYRESGNKGLLYFALKALRLQAIAGALAGIAVIFLGQPLIERVYGPTFIVPFVAIVPIGVSLAILPFINVAGCVLLTKNHFRIQLVSGVTTVLIILLLGLSLRGSFSLFDASLLIMVGVVFRAFFSVVTAALTLGARSGPLSSGTDSRRRAKKVTVVGYYGMSNFGDDLFCMVIGAHAQQLFPGHEVSFLGASAAESDVPSRRTARLARLYSSSGRVGSAVRALLAVHAVFTSDRIVLGGGSVLSGLRGVRALQWRLSAFTPVKFSALGVSIGPFSRESKAQHVAKFIRILDRIVVRDSASVAVASAMRPKALPLLGGDLAALHEYPSHGMQDAHSAQRTLGISVCNFPGFSSEDLSALIDGVTLALAATHRVGVKDCITVLALDNHPRHGDDDLARLAVAEFQRRGLPTTLIRHVDVGVEGVIAAIARCDFLVAARLHAAIVAYLSNVPFTILEYHQKCSDFCNEIGQSPLQRLAQPASSAAIRASVESLLSAPTRPTFSAHDYQERARKVYLPTSGMATITTHAPVSVIVPCYRDATTLERAVASVFEQTWPPEEVIVVDDASNDEATATVLRRLEKQYAPRLRVLVLAENSGPSVARNYGWDHATQPLVAFLDADDAWFANKLELQVPIMLMPSPPALSGHKWWFQRDADVPYHDDAESSETVTETDFGIRQLTLTRLLLRSSLSTTSVVVRRDVSERFDPKMRFSEDFDLWLRIIATHGPASFMAVTLCTLHKAPFGQSGLSSQMRSMATGQDLAVAKTLHAGAISHRFYVIVRVWNFARYMRRLALVGFLRLEERNEKRSQRL